MDNPHGDIPEYIAHIERIVAEAPPLSEEQKDRLRVLFAPSTRRR